MAEIINTFLKGKMNQDLDSRILPNGEYREATNLSISRSESSTVGQFENILGNYKISELSASVDTEIIGSFVDENSNVAYLPLTTKMQLGLGLQELRSVIYSVLIYLQ
jgi:hypothetical protein